MDKFTDRLSRKLSEKRIISFDNIYDISFAFQVIISNTFVFIFIIIVGAFLGQIVEAVVFVFTFIFLRSFDDGYHASTFSRCFFLMMCSFIICMLLPKMLDGPLRHFFVICAIIVNILLIIVQGIILNKYQLRKRVYLKVIFIAIVFLLVYFQHAKYINNFDISFLITITIINLSSSSQNLTNSHQR